MTTDKQITVPKKKKTTTVKSKPIDGEKAKAKPKTNPKTKPKPDPKVTSVKKVPKKNVESPKMTFSFSLLIYKGNVDIRK